jgi:hypothetical protein
VRLKLSSTPRNPAMALAFECSSPVLAQLPQFAAIISEIEAAAPRKSLWL